MLVLACGLKLEISVLVLLHVRRLFVTMCWAGSSLR